MIQKKYDYLIVGAGLFGSVFAHEANKRGKSCLIIDKRSHIGGNVYTEKKEDIIVHKYGAHIFHTSNKKIWEYVNSFVEFNRFTNSPLAIYKDKLFNLPFNMNTFHQMWGVKNPKEAYDIIEEQKKKYKNIINPKNLEDQALVLVGDDIYYKLIKGYTEKQWGRPATEIPSFIIKRLPLRFNYDNNYFNDKYQGIPIGGYTNLISKLLFNIETLLNVDYFKNRDYFDNIADKIIFTGKIDEFYNYEFGKLEYRSLHFENSFYENLNYQGNAVVNYTDVDIPYTRIIEHKYFDYTNQKNTIITKEFPSEFSKDNESYYPINDDKNNEIYNKYFEKSKMYKKFIFGGRLAEYKYYDMHNVIEKSLELVDKELSK